MHIFEDNKVILFIALWRLRYSCDSLKLHSRLMSVIFSSFTKIEERYCLTILLFNWLLITCYSDKLFLVDRWKMPKDNFTCEDCE